MHAKTMAGSALMAATILAGAPSALAATNQPAPTNAPSGTAKTSPTHKCDVDAHWPGYVQGRPDGFDAGDDGAYLWHNPSGGWGLRVSHPLLPGKADRVVFTGEIRSAGRIGHVIRVRDEKNDVVKVTDNGHILMFRFVNYGGVDGVDFTTTCTPGLAAGMRADGSAMPTRFIHLGDKDTHPGSNPFIVRRRDSDTGTTAPSKGQTAPGSTGSAAPGSGGSSGSGSPGTGSSGSGSSTVGNA